MNRVKTTSCRDSIFIQIASYRDPELIPTVQDAIAQAAHPERLSFGICWQYQTEEELRYIEPLRNIKNCRIEAIPAAQSRGVGWARSKTQKLWRKERYTLQIDSHTRLAPGWDTQLIDMLVICPSSKPILTAYVPAYEPPRKLINNTPTCLEAEKFWESGVLTLRASGDLSQCSTPQVGAFVSGHFIFADASIIEEVPYDPKIYFRGEEVLLAARAWTKGWDIYHPHRVVCWHYYNSGGKRPVHWEDNQKWRTNNEISEQRFRQIMKPESSKKFKVYGLGTTRSLAEYEKLTGINFQERRKDSDLELLLLCARTHIDPATAERIKTLLQKDINWTYLIETAARHRVIPLLYQSLNTTCPEAVSQSILIQLRNYFHANAARNLFLTTELLKLLNLFKERDISAIPFKGPVLAASVYGNLALRQISDLDILVSERDFERAKELLISQGYQPEKFYGWEQSFVGANNRVGVDLHQGIVQQHFSFRLDFERLWQRVEPVSLAGATVVNLSPEDLLVILSVQVAKDCVQKRESLKQLCDLAELIRVHQEMDWAQVMEQARTLHSERMLFLGLFLTSFLKGTVFPKQVWHSIEAEPTVKSLAAEVRQRLFRQADEPDRWLEKSLFSFSFSLRLKERLQDRVPVIGEFLRRQITPNDRDRALLPLPSPLHFLYYLLRPIRLVGKYGAIMLKRFPGF